MVGFNNIITFDRYGKVSNYQKSYDNQYSKTIKTFFPFPLFALDDNLYYASLYVSINNTFPKQIETIYGTKLKDDYNSFIFDVSELYRKFKNLDKIGLSQVYIYHGYNVVFKSESFRI